MDMRERLVAIMTIDECGKVTLPSVDEYAEEIGTDQDTADEEMGCILDQMIEDDALTFDGISYYDIETLEAIEEALEDEGWECDERQSYHLSVWG